MENIGMDTNFSQIG